ncbi:MAG: hypothetical protein ABH873_04150 [Candidatus Firestonebacteria bacterium]
MNNEKIKEYLEKVNLDIRQTKDARFMDQKVTPDVLCIIADCITNYIESIENENREFTTKDIWSYQYSNDNVKAIFNKPDVLDRSAKSEYDKFFQQPLKALAYSNVLFCEKRGNKNYFKVKNKNLLKYISIKERNALEFLLLYLEKVLRDSDIWKYFEDFFKNNDKQHFNELKKNYEDFILENTSIKGRVEIRRIFTKVLNPLAYIGELHGTERGFFSRFPIDYSSLMYNRRNWRDIAKVKNETRDQYEARAQNQVFAYTNYSIQKAKNIIRSLYHSNSEVHDEFANDKANQVHHIFMASDYPEIAFYLENLILLTANQHLTHAHTDNNTRTIDKDYQLICLVSKSESIEQSLAKNEPIYSKEDFLFVLESGLKVKLSNSINFQEIRDELMTIYNKN